MTTTNVFCKHGVPKGVCRLGEKDCGLPSVAEYTYVEGLSQPAPSWQGLSDDEIDKLYADWERGQTDYSNYARAIEQALKEKNNG